MCGGVLFLSLTVYVGGCRFLDSYLDSNASAVKYHEAPQEYIAEFLKNFNPLKPEKIALPLSNTAPVNGESEVGSTSISMEVDDEKTIDFLSLVSPRTEATSSASAATSSSADFHIESSASTSVSPAEQPPRDLVVETCDLGVADQSSTHESSQQSVAAAVEKTRENSLALPSSEPDSVSVGNGVVITLLNRESVKVPDTEMCDASDNSAKTVDAEMSDPPQQSATVHDAEMVDCDSLVPAELPMFDAKHFAVESEVEMIDSPSSEFADQLSIPSTS